MELVGYERLSLVGPMASGKTTLGRLLARQLGLKFIDSDHEIERRNGVSVATIFDIEGENAFRTPDICNAGLCNLRLRPSRTPN